MLLLEPINNLLERRVVLELEAVPERPLSAAVLVLLRGDGLGEAEEGKSKIDEAVLVVFQLVLSIDNLGDALSLVLVHVTWP